MNVGYSDFIKLFSVDDPQEWCRWLDIRKDGIYIKEHEGYMTPEERGIICEHPSGNLSEPALKLPCDYHALRSFVDQQGLSGNIDAFVLADFILNNKRDTQKELDHLGQSERVSLLKMVLGMAISAYDYKPGLKRNAATGDNKRSISADLSRAGLSLKPESVRKYINEAEDLFHDLL